MTLAIEVMRTGGQYNKFEASAYANGYRIETINGEKYYVASDRRGRAVVGPKARRGKSWLTFKRDTKPVSMERLTTTSEMESLEALLSRQVAPPTIPRPSRRWRIKTAFMEMFYDDAFHRSVKLTALSLMWLAVASLTTVACAKGIVWLVTR